MIVCCVLQIVRSVLWFVCMFAHFSRSGFSVDVKEALIFVLFLRRGGGGDISVVGALRTRLLSMVEFYYMLQVQMHCYRALPRAVGETTENKIYAKKKDKTSTYLILPERCTVDSVCVQGSRAIDNYSRSHGCSQLVLCPHPLTLRPTSGK